VLLDCPCDELPCASNSCSNDRGCEFLGCGPVPSECQVLSSVTLEEGAGPAAETTIAGLNLPVHVRAIVSGVTGSSCAANFAWTTTTSSTLIGTIEVTGNTPLAVEI